MTAPIEQLQHDVTTARDRLAEYERKLADAIRAAATFQPGDVVLARRRGRWQPALVRDVKVVDLEQRRVHYLVSTQRLDGAWSAMAVNAYDDVKRLDGVEVLS